MSAGVPEGRPRTVTVTGVGVVPVPRDTAVVRVAAVHRAPALADALAGAESARAVLVEVARRHVAADAVATESLDLWPAHDDAGRQDGFEARHAISVRCIDLGVAGDLLTALAAEVGDRLRVEGVSLSATETGEARRLAREHAVADARAGAVHLAGLVGATLGEVLAISDGATQSAAGQADRGWVAQAAALEPGISAVRAVLSVTWSLV